MMRRSPVRFRAADIMDYDESCFMHLTHRVIHSFPKAIISVLLCIKPSQVPIQKEYSENPEFWSLVSAVDGSILPQVDEEDQLIELKIKCLVKRYVKKKKKKIFTAHQK